MKLLATVFLGLLALGHANAAPILSGESPTDPLGGRPPTLSVHGTNIKIDGEISITRQGETWLIDLTGLDGDEVKVAVEWFPSNANSGGTIILKPGSGLHLGGLTRDMNQIEVQYVSMQGGEISLSSNFGLQLAEAPQIEVLQAVTQTIPEPSALTLCISGLILASYLGRRWSNH